MFAVAALRDAKVPLDRAGLGTVAVFVLATQG
jgi:hypothetical protein